MNPDIVIPLGVVALVALVTWVVLRVNRRRVWRSHLPVHRQERVVGRRFARASRRGGDAIFLGDEFSVDQSRIAEIGRHHGCVFVLEGEVPLRQNGSEVSRTPTYVYRRQ